MNNIILTLLQDGEQTILKAICVFLDMVKKYMFLDYHIENWIMVIDTGCLGLSSLPISGLQLIIGSMSVNYCATMDKMYILNPSFVLKTSWSIIKGFIDPESVEKISVLDPKKYKEMQQRIPLKYLQKKYSGEFEDITSYWPPQNVYCNDEERHKLLKNQPPASNRRPSKVFEQGKQNSSNLSGDLKEGNGHRQSNISQGELKNKAVSQVSNQQRDASLLIKNDGIKPKINIIKVLDDNADQSYANGGFNEELEIQLREEAQRKKDIEEQQKKSVQNQSESQTISKIKKNQGNSQNIGQSQTNAQGSGYNVNNHNTTNNINAASTDFSEVNNYSPPHIVSKNKTYNSPLPEVVDSKQEFSANLNEEQYRLLNQQNTDPLETGNYTIQENPVINFDREEVVDSSKCCKACTIF